MVIYRITNTLNGKKYIGQTRQENPEIRWKQHIWYDKYLVDIKIDEYGEDNFTFEIIYECNSIDEMNEMEQYYILEEESHVSTGKGYNVDWGGGERKRSKEVVKLMKNAWTDERKEEYSKRLSKNNPSHGGLSQEHIDKLSKSWTDERRKEYSKMYKGSVFFGADNIDEIKEKLSKAVKKAHEEGRLNNSGENHPMYGVRGEDHYMYGRKQTTETKRKLGKPVYQYNIKGELVKIWATASEASRELGINRGNISACCSDKAKNIAEGGFIWSKKALGKKELKDKISRCNIKPDKIAQLDLDLNVIRIWDSAKQIQEEMGIARQNIYNACSPNNPLKTADGFIWRKV